MRSLSNFAPRLKHFSGGKNITDPTRVPSSVKPPDERSEGYFSKKDLFFYHRFPLSLENEPLRLSDFGFAWVTEIVLPSTCFPSRSFIASCAALSAISTKPNPRDLPVSLSVITLADVTSPYLANNVFSSSSVT